MICVFMLLHVRSNHQDSDGDLLSPPLQPLPDHTTTALPSIPLPDMGFKVTSRLHPKFLIAKFPLPRKKVHELNYIISEVCHNLGRPFLRSGKKKEQIMKRTMF